MLTANHPLLKTLSAAINAYLALDPESSARLEKLAGKRVSIELLPFSFTFQCHFTNNGIEIETGKAHLAQVHLSGTPLGMAGMMLNKNERQAFFADDIKMEGEAELGMEVVELFDQLQIDWEEPLSKLIGDVPTYYASQLVKSVGGWLKHADDTMTMNVTEYLQEEAAWLPTREALQDLFSDIDTLRMDVDRVAARIAQINS